MHFTDEFIQSLRDDPVSGTIALLDSTFQELRLENEEGWTEEDFGVLLETYALLVEVIESNLLPIKLRYPLIGAGGSEQCAALYKYFNEVRGICVAEASKLRVASLRNRFRASLGTGFAYEFTQGDLERVQQLINNLREQIAGLTQLEKEHQQRLLRRLEKLQSELHKKVSDLDRFWGLIGDAGVVLGKLGNDAKPIVDRIREIADIVWQTQSRAEELPSGTRLPQLENKPSHGGEEV
jgi:uncharacterized protein YoxC